MVYAITDGMRLSYLTMDKEVADRIIEVINELNPITKVNIREVDSDDIEDTYYKLSRSYISNPALRPYVDRESAYEYRTLRLTDVVTRESSNIHNKPLNNKSGLQCKVLDSITSPSVLLCYPLMDDELRKQVDRFEEEFRNSIEIYCGLCIPKEELHTMIKVMIEQSFT